MCDGATGCATVLSDQKVMQENDGATGATGSNGERRTKVFKVLTGSKGHQWTMEMMVATGAMCNWKPN